MGSSLLSLHFFLNPSIKTQNPKFSPSNFASPSSSRFNWGSTQHQFGRREKRRNWWDDDDDDDVDDDVDLDYGFWEESSFAVDWFFKIFEAFGWMIPAIIMSTLMGTGTNSLVMAVVLPLGQTALSLVLDKLWENPNSSPKFRRGPKPRSNSNPRRRSRPEWRSYARTTKRPGNSSSYQSWGATNNPSTKRGGQSGSKYGGWDELDQQSASGVNFSEEQRQKVEGPEMGYAETGKLSRRISRDKPLFMRLLIAMFPLLGSWTRFLF